MSKKINYKKSYEGHAEDDLALTADEGRDYLRKASGRWT